MCRASDAAWTTLHVSNARCPGSVRHEILIDRLREHRNRVVRSLSEIVRSVSEIVRKVLFLGPPTCRPKCPQVQVLEHTSTFQARMSGHLEQPRLINSNGILPCPVPWMGKKAAATKKASAPIAVPGLNMESIPSYT